jgi:hypothetical protein
MIEPSDAPRGPLWAALLPALLGVLGWVLVLATYAQGGLKAIAAWYAAQLALPALSVVVLGGALFVGLRWRRIPLSSVTAVIGFLCLAPLLQTFDILHLRYPTTIEGADASATVRLPLDGPVLVGWGGDTPETNYHAVTPDQRWAYDLVVEPAFAGTEELTDYGCYGQPVFAPAAGEVVVAVDEHPDQVPAKVSKQYIDPTGNTVALKIPEGYLVIAHLQPGSVAVEAGQAVTEGQLLGRCGNSGNTSEPHVHIHLQKQDPNEFPTGFAEGLPLFFRDHDGEPMPVGGLDWVNKKALPKGVTVQHRGAPGVLPTAAGGEAPGDEAAGDEAGGERPGEQPEGDGVVPSEDLGPAEDPSRREP